MRTDGSQVAPLVLPASNSRSRCSLVVIPIPTRRAPRQNLARTADHPQNTCWRAPWAAVAMEGREGTGLRAS
jgi:hypothetical protein